MNIPLDTSQWQRLGAIVISWAGEGPHPRHISPCFALVEKACLVSGREARSGAASVHVLRDPEGTIDYIAIVQSSRIEVYNHDPDYWGANAHLNYTAQDFQRCYLCSLLEIRRTNPQIALLYDEWLSKNPLSTARQELDELRATVRSLEEKIAAVKAALDGPPREGAEHPLSDETGAAKL